MVNFVRHVLKYWIGDSQIYDIVQYSLAFLSWKNDLADTKEMSRNNVSNTAALILLITDLRKVHFLKFETVITSYQW